MTEKRKRASEARTATFSICLDIRDGSRSHDCKKSESLLHCGFWMLGFKENWDQYWM